MGFLNDLNLDNVEADPNYLAEKAQHPSFVFDSKIVTKKDNSKSWVITYKTAPEAQRPGITQDEWFSLTVADKTTGALGAPTEVQKSWLKKRVLSLGVPESRVATFEPEEVVGTPVFIAVRHANGYQNVADVTLRNEGSADSDSTAVQGGNVNQASGVSDLM